MESLFNHLRSIIRWLAGRLWDWTAVLWIVASLWGFGGIVTGASLAEAVPTGMELAGALVLFSVGSVILAARICVAAWQSKELKSIAQRITITSFVAVCLGGATVTGGKYLMGKVPRLSLAADLIRPMPPLPPPLSSPIASTKSGQTADLIATFVDPEDLELIISNPTYATAHEPTFQTILVNLDASGPNVLPIARQTGDFLKGRASLLRIPILHYGNNAASSGLKLGTRIFGWIFLSCSDCSRVRYYYIYYEYQHGGWYSESSTEPVPNGLYSNFAALSDGSMSFDHFVSADRRVPIQNDSGVNRFPEQGTLR